MGHTSATLRSTEKHRRTGSQARTLRKGGYDGGGGFRNRGKGKDYGGKGRSSHREQEKSDQDQTEISSRREDPIGKERQRCGKICARSFRTVRFVYVRNVARRQILKKFAVRKFGMQNTVCSNHMTSHRDWLVNFDSRRMVGMRCLYDVLFVPTMSSNLIGLGQLLEKGFSIAMKHGFLEVLDLEEKKIMKARLHQTELSEYTLMLLKLDALTPKFYPMILGCGT
ncbi:hypothetical protein ACSQ67_008688 [Phaseolus vulgaris]